MPSKRRCGILCHPTSMPGPYGIGELNDTVYRFIEFLQQAGQTIWQILPLGPTGYGDSPYQPFSSFAGNHLLIALDRLIDEGLLTPGDVTVAQPFPDNQVDYGRVIEFKDRVLRHSYQRFKQHASESLYQAFNVFCEAQETWLEDYALYMALKGHFSGRPWIEWTEDISLHRGDAVAHWRNALSDEVNYHRYLQFQFTRQWQSVRDYAHAADVTIVGDLPIFVGHDSADVWSNQALFRLDDRGHPYVVAGVPPDYFSPTGQLWGNPLYRWKRMQEDGYAWWMERLAAVFRKVDMVRLDHFRGFSGYWEVSAGEETAENGRWVRGPGADFLKAVQQRFGGLPIIAEDLGLISEDVTELRNQFGLPGMTVLHFAFDGNPTNPHLPYNYHPNSVAYTATHDNDTTVGWYNAESEEIKDRVRLYTGTDGNAIHWTVIRLALNSVAEMAIYPLQDVLGLGTEARMNMPGRPHGNWAWRYTSGVLSDGLAHFMRQLATVSGRWKKPQEEEEEPLVLEYEESQE